jgi:4-hydroxythreonine-4-phosphate dehydrogenase
MAPANKKPIVAVSMGDPTGIGPEVIVKALRQKSVWKECHPVIFGDLVALRKAMEQLSVELPVEVWEGKGRDSRVVPIVPGARLASRFLTPGRPSKVTGEASFRYIWEATQCVLRGEADALCTGPINKAWVQKAGHPYPGHTEMLADWSGVEHFRMMMVARGLRVVLVTIHLPLSRVSRYLTKEAVFRTIVLTDGSLKRLFGVPKPKIAVAGFNPHAGEEGILGPEEKRAIGPAVSRARRGGLDVKGPLAADALFARVAEEKYDAVVCMYHDQGLIPVKLLDFYGGVNLTLGLPFVRTSVDHGTANDIAGKGIANASSMIAAIRLAAELARKKAGIDPA